MKNWGVKPVKFRDPPQGYIEIPRIYVKNLIDTPYMQRLHGVAQTGIKPLFPTASHDRFCHSLGVYRYAMLAYKSMRKSIEDNADTEELKGEWPGILCALKRDLDLWQVLLSIAGILHDVGHPVGSHAFEFLYDDILLRFPPEETIDMRSPESRDKHIKEITEIRESLNKNDGASYENSELKKELRKLLDIKPGEDVAGSPHERMGAYMILSKQPYPGDHGVTLYDAVEKTIIAYVSKPDKQKEYEEYREIVNDSEKKENFVKDCVQFIARMITGQKYAPAYNPKFDRDSYLKSARDCIITILNGIIDADSIDYTMRNAYYGGYATHQVDYDRLCASFSVYPYEKYRLRPCFSTGAISVVEGFITARNAEPKWLYGHHKVVYHSVLTKQLFYYTARYLCLLDFQDRIDDVFAKSSGGSVRVDDSLNVSIPTADTGKLELLYQYFSYFSYMLSPLVPYLGTLYNFYASNDATLEALFRDVQMRLSYDSDRVIKYDPRIFTEDDRKILTGLLTEYISRKFKRSLWKSYSAYTVLITDVAKKLTVSRDTIHKYMLQMIRSLPDPISFRFAESEGNSANGLYEEEKIYRFKKDSVRVGVGALDIDTDIPPVSDVFGMEGLCYPDCVCKIFKGHFKRGFGELPIVTEEDGSRVVKLSELNSDLTGTQELEFPYIYVASKASAKEDSDDSADNLVKQLLAEFKRRFTQYCRKCIEKTAFTVQWEMTGMKDEAIIRDVIYGDILLPYKFRAVIETREFQRLLRIKQLALTSNVFPSANHTRFEHSLGTYYIMSKVVAHFREIFKDMGTEPKEDDSEIALLAALLHDVGHGAFSHAFESVCGTDHEEWTKRIILEPTELHNTICRKFGKNAPERVVGCLKRSDEVKRTAYTLENLNFSLIYAEIISGALDVDRMDFIPRDAYYTASKFGAIDISRIISAISLTSVHGDYCLCFDEANLPYLRQFVFARREMYANVYFNAPKVMIEALAKNIIRRAIAVRNDLAEADRILLDKLDKNSPAALTLEDYIQLDDNIMYGYFMAWRKSNDKILSIMCHSLIGDNSDEITKYQYTGRIVCSVSDFFAKILQITGIHYSEDVETSAGFAFLFEKRSTTVYPISDDTAIGDGRRIRLLLGDGSLDYFGRTEDFSVNSSYVRLEAIYYNFTVLKEELKANGQNECAINKIVSQVTAFIESQKPRRNIEIEYKYTCGTEDELDAIKKLLGETQTHPVKTEKDNAIACDGFRLESNGFQQHYQTDTYFDTQNKELYSKKMTLRLRKGDGKIKMTVKSSNKSDNFGSGSPLARNEHETIIEGMGPNITVENFREILDSQKEYLREELGLSDESFASLVPVLELRNAREIGKIGKEGAVGFSCDICLDRFTFFSGEKPSEQKFQIEIELTSNKYLSRVVLDRFALLVRQSISGLHDEEKSKFALGIEWIESQSIN